jgi:hypothetical protein
MSKDAIYGRGPNGRAIRKDGGERKERRTLTPSERLAQLAQQTINARASIGRAIFGTLPGMSAFVSGIGTFRRWIRDARSYATEDARIARRAYFQRQLDTIDAKGDAAEGWLPGADKAVTTISGLYQNIGEAVEEFVRKNGREPTAAEGETIVSRYLSEDVRKVVEDANDPDNDPFHDFRRDADTEDAEDTDADTLD